MTFKHNFLVLFLGIFSFLQINAEQTAIYSKSVTFSADSIDNEDEDDEPDTTVVIPDDFDSSLDFLLYSWGNSKNVMPGCDEKPNPEEVTEIEYKSRLKKLPHVIEMPYNPVVKSFIEVYTQKRRKQVEYMLGLSRYYFPTFEDDLEASKLPLELKFLPVIESALTPTAISRAGAGGLWQFMISTGRMYGLEINSLVDERFDPVKSSKIAVKYLKELFSIYGDWNLAIAAYNCGPGNVNKAIRRAGGKRDFWEIYPYLPRETRGYVPIFIAANYVMTYYNEHNLCPAKVTLSTMTDTVMVNKRIHFEQIASVLDISMDELRLFNPQYKRDIVPGDIKPYSICLPVKYINPFIEKLNDILVYKADELTARRDEIILLSPEIQPIQHKEHAKNSGGNYTTHTVRRGQTLGGIARKYRVTVAQIKRWNNMGQKSTIKQGQRLKIRK